MYAYEWDSSTGGYILTPMPLAFSKEPRPVYYKELDILGFDKYWDYDKNDSFPYMWAEANNYYYRGRLVAKTKGGSLYTPPELVLIEDPEPEGYPLRFVDIPAMVDKNRQLMEQLVQETIKKIYNTFIEYKDKVDVFYVAFSGGKDSVVTLDLVQRALPHNEFKVLFGDTGMEFPDTYETVDEIESFCSENNIEFLVSKSQYEPEYTWSQFGPPATVHRWCCSVHKTSPQIILLRNVLKKVNFTGMAFIGVRASESLSRNEYDYVSLGEKHKGQYSCNPILEWNSSELYSYIYMRNLYLNKAYKKGNRRAGCLVCPRAAERNEYMARVCYPNEFDSLMNNIREVYAHNFQSEKKLDEFIRNGGWKARKNGRDLPFELNYKEKSDARSFYIIIDNPKTDWRQWIKTIGVIKNDRSPYIIDFRGDEYKFEVKENDKHIELKYDISLAKKAPLFTKLLKNVFRKTACCIGCKECEADCHNGMLHMKNGNVIVDDGCMHCSQCHKVDKGCLVYKSLEMPKGGTRMGKTPIYLIKELEIIDDLLTKIKASILAGTYNKAIIISDHGASRLAVLHETENIWSMETKGEHSGRCCKVSEINDKPDFAIEESGYWILANYDRFRGSRRANVEVHGGASMEEVAVPIIEITQKASNIEAFIVDESRVLTLGAKEYAIIKIYVGIRSNNISIKLEGNYYNVEETVEPYIYSVELKNYSKKGKFFIDILDGGSVLASGQQFEIEKKGMSQNNMFDF